MSTPGLRTRRKEMTRADITRAATELFVRSGFAATTVEEIAVAAGVSTRTVFRYFPTKDAMLTEPFMAPFDAWERHMLGAPAGERLLDVIRAATHRVLDIYEEDPDFWDRHYTLTTSDAAVAAHVLQVQAQLQLRAAAVLAQRLGLAPDDLRARVVAAAAMAGVGEAVRQYYAAGGRRRRRSVIDAAYREVARALELLNVPLPPLAG